MLNKDILAPSGRSLQLRHHIKTTILLPDYKSFPLLVF
jgi:hypothetical protein